MSQPKSDKIRVEGIDFQYRDDLVKNFETDIVPIEILVDPYKGIVYNYKTVGFSAKDTLSFTYDILKGDRTYVSPELHTIMGDILVSVMIKGMDYNESRKNDLKKPDSKRKLRKKSSSLP